MPLTSVLPKAGGRVAANSRVKIRHTAQFYSRQSLEHLLELFPALLEECEQEPSKEVVLEVCRLTRSTWDRYLDAVLLGGASNVARIVEGSLDGALAVTRSATESLDGEDRNEAELSLKNITTRIQFATILREEGLDRLIQAMNGYAGVVPKRSKG